jgi:hypothetical protein
MTDDIEDYSYDPQGRPREEVAYTTKAQKESLAEKRKKAFQRFVLAGWSLGLGLQAYQAHSVSWEALFKDVESAFEELKKLYAPSEGE